MEHDNPYQNTPGSFDDGWRFGPSDGRDLPPGRDPGMVGHVPIVGWLLIGHSILALVFGVLLVLMPFLVLEQVTEALQENPAFRDFTPEELRSLVSTIYLVMGIGLIILALLSLFAGIQMLRFRMYPLGVMGFLSCFLTLLTGFYCCLTGFPIGIYGLVVLFNSPVRQAFELGRQGYTSSQIRAAFRKPG